MKAINYARIASAIENYKMMGYEYIETPWLVKESTVRITLTVEARAHKTNIDYKCLVGSGEQSFLEIKNQLCPSKKYQTVTPCFRDEKYDELHLPWFIKLELIYVLWKDENANAILNQVTNDAQKVLRTMSGVNTLVKTEDGFDINVAGIEVGSYGIRSHHEFKWVYGTGIAEPRMSQAIARSEEIIDKQNKDLMQ